jgi:hypothetical protein
MAETRTNGKNPSRSPRAAKQPIQFYKFPKAVVVGLLKANYSTAWPLVAAILETYYDDYEKKNPVKLTSKKLKKYGISKDQKARGLKVLEGIDQFSIERFPRQNPLISLKWELTKD